MKILNEFEISKWAYNECLNGNDTPEIRKLITDSKLAYWYCKNIKDRKELWSKITDSEWAYWYCNDIKDRPEIRKLYEITRNLKK